MDLDDSGAREASANVAVSTKAVASVASSGFAVCAWAWPCAAAERAARASSSVSAIFFGYNQSITNGYNRAANAPALRLARVKDASVGACIYEREREKVGINNKPTKTQNTFQKDKKKEIQKNKNDRMLTSGHSTVRAFMFIT